MPSLMHRTTSLSPLQSEQVCSFLIAKLAQVEQSMSIRSRTTNSLVFSASALGLHTSLPVHLRAALLCLDPVSLR